MAAAKVSATPAACSWMTCAYTCRGSSLAPRRRVPTLAAAQALNPDG